MERRLPAAGTVGKQLFSGLPSGAFPQRRYQAATRMLCQLSSDPSGSYAVELTMAPCSMLWASSSSNLAPVDGVSVASTCLTRLGIAIRGIAVTTADDRGPPDSIAQAPKAPRIPFILPVLSPPPLPPSVVEGGGCGRAVRGRWHPDHHTSLNLGLVCSRVWAIPACRPIHGLAAMQPARSVTSLMHSLP
ncbi:hypothetical protein GQ53DRAFT_438520 [Thozetella sp. PMI_491]|nr:hypothetical protein GQ53DRAFT_438520 [Thozetella sp. PMI_491]